MLIKVCQLFSRCLTLSPEDGELREYRYSFVEKLRLLSLWVLLQPFERELASLHGQHSFNYPNDPKRQKSTGTPPTPSHRHQQLYRSTLVWYILNQLPEVFTHHEETLEHLWDFAPSLAMIKNNDNRTHSIDNESPYGCMLRWYHSASVSRIYTWLRSMDELRYGNLMRSCVEFGFHSTYWQRKAGKALRLYTHGRFHDSHLEHRVAYLGMLGAELGIEDIPTTQDGSTCLDIIRKIVLRQTEPGDEGIARGSKSHPALRELCCLERHLPDSLGLLESETEWESSLRGCREFLTSDYTFTPSLLTNTNVPASDAEDWWDLKTSSIICAELIDHAMKKLDGGGK